MAIAETSAPYRETRCAAAGWEARPKPTARSLPGRGVGTLGLLVGAQAGTQENGIHEVTGSIPVSSTNSSNKLAAASRDTGALCLRCVSGGRQLVTTSHTTRSHGEGIRYWLPYPSVLTRRPARPSP